jgi:hypothetical protein
VKGTQSPAKIVAYILAKLDCRIRFLVAEASLDEGAADGDNNLWGPGFLGFTRIPELSEKPLKVGCQYIMVIRTDRKLTSRST